jgi:hypothetical protein
MSTQFPEFLNCPFADLPTSPVNSAPSLLTANCPHEMAQFGQNQFLQRKLTSAWRTGKAKEDFAVSNSREGSAHYRCALDFAVTERPEKFAETFKFFVKEGLYGFNGDISRRQTCAASRDDGINFFVSQP